MATAKLSRTMTTGNRKIFTFSTWFKSHGTSAEQNLMGFYSDANNYIHLRLDSNSQMAWKEKEGGSNKCDMTTTQKFRDPSAWYHLVLAVDTSQAGSSDRIKLYVNGTQVTAWQDETYYTQDYQSQMNYAPNVMYVGGNSTSGDYFSGVMAHTHYIDGTQYAASDFGETDSTSGIWVAKTSPSVTYGDNGFFLKYQDTSNFGDDSSGETNDLTMSGTITQTQDTPDNNFCTWNPLNVDHGETYTFKNGNTIALIPSASGWSGTSGTLFAGAGKWYVEGYVTYTPGAYNTTFGFASDAAIGMKSAYGQIGYMDPGSLSTYAPTFGVYDTGTLLYSTTSAINQSTASWTTAWASGDYVMFAIDIDNGKFYYGVNGSWTGASSNPSAGTGGYTFTPGGYKYTPMTTIFQEELQVNFGNGYFGTTVAGSNSDSEGYGKFKYTPPTGYLALCTKNLATYG